MACDQQFVDFVVHQLTGIEDVLAKKMFGEYGLYAQGKMVGLICDNSVFIKPTAAGRNFLKEVVEAPPYPGAKPSFLLDDQIQDALWFSELVRLTVNELPKPRPKKKKK